MLIFLLVLLCIGSVSAQDPKAVCVDVTPDAADKVRTAFLRWHNKLREAIVKQQVDQDVGDNLLGSRSLFKLNYDCSLEGLAMTTIPTGCTHKPNLGSIPAGKSVNYKVVPTNDADAANRPKMIRSAVEHWYDSHYEDNLDDTVTYNNDRMEPFANV
ncbi:hypothetical protein ANCDUO_05320 [Ancylostoma duodenale]|uniref:SCP domain-containing protein n=1 Tax=Ancylostoma duodenale TaxID=51022 RepID=A0A0C2GYZ7_9BILA|nr:hypothetical protein ANCDUO_05320 [Ancylostoma duodenale]